MLPLAVRQADLAQLEQRLKELYGERERYGEGLTLEAERAARRRDKQIAALETEIGRRNQDVTEFLEDTNAKRSARRRALKAAQQIIDEPEIAGPKDFAPKLLKIFCAEFSSRGMKNAAFRFIASFARHVTGEDVRWETIKKFVNRGRRARGDKW